MPADLPPMSPNSPNLFPSIGGLWRHDILGSMAHAEMLHKIGVLKHNGLTAIVRGLDQIGKEIKAGKFKWNPALEDVHMNIEAELTKRVPTGAKLHTARSRNDQVALDIRLWLRDEITSLLKEIADLQRALVSLGEKNSDVIIPGYTHLQRAQPVYLAHHLLAYVEMLERDCERLWDCHSRVNVCPLGSGAIAGSTLPLDRVLVAKLLNFVDVDGKVQLTQNSMDAVSDRDFAVEFCAAGALLAVHLSRLAEDVILWAGAEFNFIKITDAYTTGSSLIAAEKKPRHRRTRARQDWPRLRQPDVTAHAAERIADDLQPRFAGGQGTPLRHRRHRARLDADFFRDVAPCKNQSRRVRRRRVRPGIAGDRPRGLSGEKRNAISPGASRRRRSGGAGGKNRQTAEPAHAHGTASHGQNLWPRRVGCVQSENRDGETQPNRRTGNQGSRKATGALAGAAFVK
ncbi:MAG: argininosuccinate lyase [Limisphaerales bacterium]